MKFRTEIEPLKCEPITVDSHLLMMGSCFVDNIGAQLIIDGFNVSVNPTGVLYNPASIASLLNRTVSKDYYSEADIVTDAAGIHHLLDFPNKVQSNNAEELLSEGNRLLDTLNEKYREADTLIITFGTAYVFDLIESRKTVGNCHKLPTTMFSRRKMDVEEIVKLWLPLIKGKRVIFTVSPIRHLADGLHGNTLSKSTLLLAVDTLVKHGAEYFPAYEIMMDDLRDYRFYAADMKHPSEVAVEYIYDIFKAAYFTQLTEKFAAENHKRYKFTQHRQLL